MVRDAVRLVQMLCMAQDHGKTAGAWQHASGNVVDVPHSRDRTGASVPTLYMKMFALACLSQRRNAQLGGLAEQPHQRCKPHHSPQISKSSNTVACQACLSHSRRRRIDANQAMLRKYCASTLVAREAYRLEALLGSLVDELIGDRQVPPCPKAVGPRAVTDVTAARTPPFLPALDFMNVLAHPDVQA